MTAAAWISLIVPVATFLLGHWHVILPNPLGSGMPALPTGAGQGQVATYLLQLLAHVLSSQSAVSPSVPTPVPAQPVQPSQPTTGDAVILKLLSVLEQSIQQPQAPAKAA